jgi:hypothetical protein
MSGLERLGFCVLFRGISHQGNPMNRRVAYGKAIRAGTAGALVWALFLRLLLALKIPVFDFIHASGTLLLPRAAEWQWLSAGMLLHSLIGAAFAILYAYFFWSEYPWRPALQGLVFSMGPALLAGLVMVPQLHGMTRQYQLDHFGNYYNVGIFARHLGPWGPIGIIAGHALYGLTLGCLYTHPVGYPARPRSSWQRFWGRRSHG